MKTEFGKMDATGKVTITHRIDLSKIKSPDPLAYAFGYTQAQRGEPLSKDKDLAPEYVRGWKDGKKKLKEIV